MNDNEMVERPPGVLIHAAINATVAVAFGIRLPWAIGSFREIFVGVGAGQGASTKLVLATPYAWMVFALGSIGLLIWVGMKSRMRRAELQRTKLLVRGFTVAFGLALAFTVWALYTPIFKLGAVD